MGKTRPAIVIIIAICIILAGVVLLHIPVSGTTPVSIPDEKVKTTYDVLIPPGNGNSTEVDHIILRGGSQQDIGYALARIAIDKYGATLISYDDPVYGKAREEYIRLHDPGMYQRIQGIKKAYGQKADDYSQDASSLIYIFSYPFCSAIYFPPDSTQDHHAYSGKDLEWIYNPQMNEFNVANFLNPKALMINRVRNRINVVEIYPDDGYATLVVGSLDLANGAFDGINEKGLSVTVLEDSDTYVDPGTAGAGGTSEGLNFLQLGRSVLGNCASVEEAKDRILENRVSMPYMGAHFLISDPYGNATIVEFDNVSRKARFTDYHNVPVPVTNYAIYLTPDYTNLRITDPGDIGDDYYRMHKLHGYIDTHAGLFNETDIRAALKLVEANAHTSADEILPGTTIRLVYTDVTDLNEKTMTVRFYLRDGPVSDPAWGTHELVMSEPFTFRLKP
ncbi:carcinine hydrolase/isopenicillin-N N-acyltransferase family protein [uncultured Methanoregula sp.]|uniref:carcinine hydrolase/isopenicillin-N N-acyltransferase family protein n=1 Tax=uncultured Methanoregula sp. TaxID=1005933 RepID=UPI002AAC0CC3|nr:carcinine hydrolase/isopenicillin-N N-acyltransferase family protein [uncultured Methanoregula sp.]